jgi:hypothetical protein
MLGKTRTRMHGASTERTSSKGRSRRTVLLQALANFPNEGF